MQLRRRPAEDLTLISLIAINSAYASRRSHLFQERGFVVVEAIVGHSCRSRN
jgi:hypothetical protein